MPDLNELEILEPRAVDFLTKANEKFAGVSSYAFQEDTIYQVIIIIGAYILSSIIYRFMKPRIEKFIQKSYLPGSIKRLVNNIKKLLIPLMTLIMIFVTTLIVSTDSIGMSSSLSSGMMKAIFAWIIIRITTQFIDNNMVRNIFSIGIWAVAALSIFGLLGPAVTTLESIGMTVGDSRLSAFTVIKTAFSLIMLLYFATFVSAVAEKKILKTSSFTRSSQVLIAKIIRVVLIVVALLIGITSSGINLSLFAVFGGAIGLGIGFGLQKVISNLFSGMLLLIDRSIEPGDVIELENGTFGWVNHMAARYTEIVTRDNKSFLIPNEEFITQRVVNWNHGNNYIRQSIEFGVHYNSDMHRVIEIAIEAAKIPERVVDYRQPLCWITEFGDSSVNFKLNFWIKDAQNGLTNIKGEVFLALWDAFKENDIQIPYPHREVFMHSVK